MMPEPLHPAIVHFPIVLAVLAALAAPVVALAIRARRLPARAWLAVVALQALLVGSAWAALETGENEEERVEEVVAERHLEEHEEAAERFFQVAIAGLVVSGAGLVGGAIGMLGRLATVAVAAGALAAVVATGHSGGELVYRHGAGAAYTESARDAGAEVAGGRSGREREEHED